MARLDLAPNVPIPVIKATNYKEQFAAQNTKKRLEDSSLGPYSSLFDWKNEEARVEADHTKKQVAQQKIMRTNAIGDAFRLLFEGVGAATGATITPRNVNPAILNAVNDYGKNDTEYMQRLEGIKTKKLALAQADLQYNMNQGALGVEKAEKQADRSHQEAMAAEKELNNFIRENAMLEKQYKLRGLESEAEAARKNVQMGTEAQLQIGLARKKAQFDRGMDLLGDGTTSNINVKTKPEKGDKTKMEFIVPDTKETIYLPQGLVDHIRTYLQHGKGQYDQSVPAVLRAAMKNDAVKPESLYTAISDSWDYIKSNILPPDVYVQIYGAEPGKTTDAQGQPVIPGNAVSQQPAGDWQELLLDDIQKTFDDSSVKDMDQLFIARDKIMKEAKANGEEISVNDAMLQAKELKKTWRQNQQK